MNAPDTKWLVLGYGSELHGDDAAGPTAARQIEQWRLDGVLVKIVHQLTPEIAEEISRVPFAVFLDASTAVEKPVLRPVEPNADSEWNPHASAPQTILTLAKVLYERHPRAWLAAIPASHFDLGAPLSEPTAKAVQESLIQVRELLDHPELPGNKSYS